MTQDAPAYGLWVLVVLNSAVFLMFAFSFFKPNTARDWRTFGAFAAFIVALFVEMDGFPLSIYLMSGWLQTKYPNLDLLSHNAGHLWSTLRGETGDPHFGPLHIASYVLLGSGFYLLSSAWNALYRAQRRCRGSRDAGSVRRGVRALRSADPALQSPSALRGCAIAPANVTPTRVTNGGLDPSRSKKEIAMSSIHSKLVGLFVVFLVAIAPTLALGQARQVREGVTLYWGLVPAEVVAEKHALEEMHGVVPQGGGQNHHLVIALFNADGKRIVDAVVQAQLHEVGIVDAPRKYLTPMIIDGQASYGQLFSTVKDGPYQFRILVKLPHRATDIEFAVSAWSPHRATR